MAAKQTRGIVKVEGWEHIQAMLKDGQIITPEWRHMMEKALAHMEQVGRSRAPKAVSGRLDGGFRLTLAGGALPLNGSISNIAKSNAGDPYPLYLNAGSRKGTPYRMATTGARFKSGSRKGQLKAGKLTRGWLSNVVKLVGVKRHVEGLLQDVIRGAEAKWRR